jgi:uncharacterized RDD family membrane protein YckC
MYQDIRFTSLPDPEWHPELYADLPAKRLVAFLADSVIAGVLTLVLLPFTGFLAVFFLPFFYAAVAFVYRFLALAGGSATPGMRLVAIEIRDHEGRRLSRLTALLHTLIFTLALTTLLPVLISAGLMLWSQRHQGLHDLLLGTSALNRPARF